MALQANKGSLLKKNVSFNPKFPSIFSLTDIEDVIHSAIIVLKNIVMETYVSKSHESVYMLCPWDATNFVFSGKIWRERDPQAGRNQSLLYFKFQSAHWIAALSIFLVFWYT